MGRNFNQPLIVPDFIKHLILGADFNQKLILSSSSSIEFLHFGDAFNKPIFLPNSLKTLEFGGDFNQPISLPPQLHTLKFGNSFNHPIILPASITYLSFGAMFMQDLAAQVLPHLTHLTLKNQHCLDTILCLSSLTHLHIEQPYDILDPMDFITVEKVPESVTHLRMEEICIKVHQLPPKLISLDMPQGRGMEYEHDGYIEPIPELIAPIDILPSSLTYLTFNNAFNQPIAHLPASLTHLKFGHNFNHPIPHFPPHLIHLYFGNKYNHLLTDLPPLQFLGLGTHYEHKLHNLPSSITKFEKGFERFHHDTKFSMPFSLFPHLQQFTMNIFNDTMIEAGVRFSLLRQRITAVCYYTQEHCKY